VSGRMACRSPSASATREQVYQFAWSAIEYIFSILHWNEQPKNQ
jgi:hypothetical protein